MMHHYVAGENLLFDKVNLQIGKGGEGSVSEEAAAALVRWREIVRQGSP
jgi:hypothetical protein